MEGALCASGNTPMMLAKVGTLGADAVVLDLEDREQKEAADAARDFALCMGYSRRHLVSTRIARKIRNAAKGQIFI